MPFTLISIVIGIIALILNFAISSNVAGWFVWGIYGIMSLFFLIWSFIEYNSSLKGEPKNIGDIMGMASFPFSTSIMIVALIIFLFLDISKLHLLWIYPVVALFFDFTIGRRAGKIYRAKILEEEER